MSDNAVTKACTIAFTLSCLAEGVLQARREIAVRKEAERMAGLEANTQARWY